jgi:serine/threonine-protein kinase
MTSFDTPSGQRAALISPGSALAPQNTEARTEYLQQRLRLLSRLVLSLGGFFLFAGVVHRFVFFHEGPLARLSPEPALLTHLAVLSLQGLLWLTLRKKRWSVRQLHGLDAALLLGTLAGIAFQFQHLKLGQQHQTHLLIVLATLALSLCRAVIVPSTPLATLAVSLLATAPALWVATREGGAGAGYEVVSFTAIWSVATVALATFTSSVLYGLRCRVREAQLGQYVIERKLGEGGMGEVYLARHSLLRRPTAIKLLPPERVGHQTVRRFEREVRATSRLTHPNTVAIYDYGRTAEGTFYYAMEYLEGCDLQRLVRDVGPLPPARVVHILDQVAGALAGHTTQVWCTATSNPPTSSCASAAASPTR